MEFLDPKKQRRYRLFLWLSYSVVAVGVALGVTWLLWQAYGYSIKNGQVIQDGMVFLSSQPNPASIYINGALNSSTTNTRLTIPSGTYSFAISASGYRSWTHVIPVLGDQVVHYDYPLLFPTKLTSTKIDQFSGALQIASQSPNRRYLVVSNPATPNSFLMYDLTAPHSAPVSLSLPSGLISSGQSQSWQVVGWADDNQHLLLDHLYDNNQEFIELDTQAANQSLNLNRTFNINPDSAVFNNLKYNQFYFYDAAHQTLISASLGSTALTTVVSNVVAFRSYLSSTILYATSEGAPAGQVAVDITNGNGSYFVRDLPSANTYLLNMASYNGNDYAVVGDSSDSYVYIYENPLNQISVPASANQSGVKITPFRVIKLSQPNYDSFAPNAQFILVENGSDFAIYDILNDATYHYRVPNPLDPPQTHAQWMDGDRLIYVSNGYLSVADFDDTNRQILTSALPQYQVFFAPDYHSYFSLTQGSGSIVNLEQTSLLAS